ncbi:DUF1638 domain-containing protein [uncultured Jannaschia sp.]|uniref:DUF1638 domain-containing protein n=1 Tax=uncultured Jannaschia sp. TaxID=293347 RepID=UPI002610ADBF|nr:DUF1638 domain-containing protein [uncultured Jannaschia sp.]
MTARRGGRAARLGAVPPADDPLIREGLTPRAPADRAARVLVLACGALAHEITAITRQAGLDHVDLHCLPAILHNHPDRIPGAVTAALDAATGYGATFLAYADCGTGGALARLADARGIAMLPGAHCYAFYEGVEAFAARGEIDAFYLTDFLARSFDAFVTRPLGLDRHPELRDMYFGHYRRLVYLAQTDDPALDARARAAAVSLGLSFERRHTGYGDLTPVLGAIPRPLDPPVDLP